MKTPSKRYIQGHWVVMGALFLSCLVALLAMQQRPVDEWDRFITALEKKENSHTNKPSPCGGVGVLQITKIFVRDANRICELCNRGERFACADRTDPAKSRQMTRIVLGFYKSVYELNWFQTAQVHNGGPDGWCVGGEEFGKTFMYATDVMSNFTPDEK